MKNKTKIELLEEIEHLQRLVVKDELTNAFNRRGFYDRVNGLFSEVVFLKRKGESEISKRKKFLISDLSLLFVDVDGLKKINDAHGHRAGDKVISDVCRIIGETIRSADFVGRWGGDEFLVALVGSSEEDAYKIAEKIREAVATDKGLAICKKIAITLSVGVAEESGDLLSIDDLIERADKAMYEAKNNRGKNNTVKYSQL